MAGAMIGAGAPGQSSRPTCATGASSCCGARFAASGAPNVRIVQADLLAAAALRALVRLRARRCALLGPRHAPPRSGHPLAAAGARPGGARRGAAADAAARRRRWSRRAGGWSTPRVRASRRRTKWSIDRVPRGVAAVSDRSLRGDASTLLPQAVVDGRGLSADAAACAWPRGVLRRRCSHADRSGLYGTIPHPWLFELASGARARSCCSAAPWSRPMCCLPRRRCARAAGARGAGARSDEPHRQRSDGDRGRPRAHAQGRRGRADPTRRSPPAASSRRNRPRDRRPAASAACKVWLSAGLRATSMPALAGETERTAQLRLAQDGLALASVSEIRSPEYPSDVVARAGAARQERAARASRCSSTAATGARAT